MEDGIKEYPWEHELVLGGRCNCDCGNTNWALLPFGERVYSSSMTGSSSQFISGRGELKILYVRIRGHLIQYHLCMAVEPEVQRL